MGVINRLDKETVAQLTTGEVIDRPAAVVKELIENALDAEATYIKVNLQESGLKTIEVIDDGQGMAKDDLEICMAPHTTSKIGAGRDLIGVTSFGFRGQALGSIAAISKVTIASRPRHQRTGYKLVRHLSQQHPAQVVNMSKGTIATVENIFGRTPVKQRFFKSAQLEFRFVMRAVTQFALAQPTVGFQVTNNHQVVMTLAADQTLYQRLIALLGPELTTSLAKVNFAADVLKLKGYVSQPGAAAKSRQHQYLYINGRSVSDPGIARTIKTAYAGLLGPHTQPSYLLFLEMPPTMIDVNVHPRKETVALMDQKLIMQFVAQAMTDHFAKQQLSYSTLLAQRNGLVYQQQPTPASVFAGRQSAQTWQLIVEGQDSVVQLHHRYILVNNQQGLYLVDQHAAHERILFEQFRRTATAGGAVPTANSLPVPVDLQLSALQKLTLEPHLPTLKLLGLEIEAQAEAYLIKSVPVLFDQDIVRSVICRVILDLDSHLMLEGVEAESDRVIGYLACRSAVQSGDGLTKNQMKMLIQKLSVTPNNLACLHGGPIAKKFTWSEVGQWFGRK